jgi:hypothetical protein
MKIIEDINNKNYIIDNSSETLKFLALKGLRLSPKTLINTEILY